MFDISDTGDIILVDMTLLNGSTVHMVAVATDSGIPPRQVEKHAKLIRFSSKLRYAKIKSYIRVRRVATWRHVVRMETVGP
jgi:hypothetical protein